MQPLGRIGAGPLHGYLPNLQRKCRDERRRRLVDLIAKNKTPTMLPRPAQVTLNAFNLTAALMIPWAATVEAVLIEEMAIQLHPSFSLPAPVQLAIEPSGIDCQLSADCK